MPSDLQITNIKDQANANSAITIASDGQITVNQNNPTITLGSNATFPTGHIIQQKTSIYTGDTTLSGTATIASDLNITLTLSAGSDVVIFVSMTVGMASGNRFGFYVSKSGTTALTGNIADAFNSNAQLATAGSGIGGNGVQNFSFLQYDENVSAGSTTYSVIGFAESGATLKINRSDANGTSASIARGVSSITAFEFL